VSPDFGGKSVQGELLAGQLASEPGQCCRVVCPGAVFFDDGAQARTTSAPTPLLDPAALLRASRRAAAATHRPADRPVPSWRYVGNDVPLRTGCAPADSNQAERRLGARCACGKPGHVMAHIVRIGMRRLERSEREHDVSGTRQGARAA